MPQENKNFDTYKHVKDFEKAGFQTLQAEPLVSVISASREFDISHLATKEQLSHVEEKLVAQIATSQAGVIAIIKETSLSNLKRTIGIVGSVFGVIIGFAYKLLLH